MWRFWLGLRLVRGVGPVVYQGLLRAFGEPAAVFAAGGHALECAGVRPELARAIRDFDGWRAVDDQLARMSRAGASLVTWNDSAYPGRLRTIHDPPPFLFVAGRLHPADDLAVAVVGSRNVSGYGMRLAREITQGLVRYGVTVVSGLARGTDAAAHWTALRGGGRTIAVLGSGLDVVYPSEHHTLFRSVTSQGAVMSELFMGAQPDAENFPGRNRIISGLSLGTVVIEAAEKSGSLITALLAADQGREVFAVPGPVGERTRGTHHLIRTGAKLTESVEHILEEVAPHLLGRRRSVVATTQLSGPEAMIVSCLETEPVHIDGIIARSGMAASVVLPILLGLELRGVVQQLPGKVFAISAVDVRQSLAKR